MLIHDYADLGDVRLHYVSEGQGDLILFAHGFPEFWYVWKDLLAEFSRDHRVVALDMRGYNLSSKPTDPAQYAPQYAANDLVRLAKHLGYDKFTLVGHDWGGITSWVCAGIFGAHIEKLIIINAPHPTIFQREMTNNPAQQKAFSYAALFRQPQVAEAQLSANGYAALLAIFEPLAQQGHFSAEDKAAYVEAWSQPGALTGALSYYRVPPTPPPTAPLMINVPTLVIWGEQDQALLTGNLDGLSDVIPNLTIARIPDGTHWVIHEQPALIAEHIRTFIGA
jgi:pimeloyl-ACP methyl ester carboxylesterase